MKQTLSTEILVLLVFFTLALSMSWNDKAVTGFLISNANQLPGDYGVPYNIYTGAQVINAQQTNGKTYVSVEGAEFVWPIGYYYDFTQKKAIAFPLDGTASGKWIAGTATAVISAEGLRDADNYVFAYFCIKKDDGTYKCGCKDDNNCRKWQVQSFDVAASSAACGNGIIDGSDECDGTIFPDARNTCEKVSPDFTGGTLKCTQCKIDTTSCLGASAKKYSCSSGSCVEDASGQYLSSDCDGACSTTGDFNIATQSLPDGTAGQGYLQYVSANSGTGITWTASGLPLNFAISTDNNRAKIYGTATLMFDEFPSTMIFPPAGSSWACLKSGMAPAYEVPSVNPDVHISLQAQGWTCKKFSDMLPKAYKIKLTATYQGKTAQKEYTINIYPPGLAPLVSLCTLTSAAWSAAAAKDGDSVNFVIGSSNCNGPNYKLQFDIREQTSGSKAIVPDYTITGTLPASAPIPWTVRLATSAYMPNVLTFEAKLTDMNGNAVKDSSGKVIAVRSTNTLSVSASTSLTSSTTTQCGVSSECGAGGVCENNKCRAVTTPQGCRIISAFWDSYNIKAGDFVNAQIATDKCSKTGYYLDVVVSQESDGTLAAKQPSSYYFDPAVATDESHWIIIPWVGERNTALSSTDLNRWTIQIKLVKRNPSTVFQTYSTGTINVMPGSKPVLTIPSSITLGKAFTIRITGAKANSAVTIDCDGPLTGDTGPSCGRGIPICTTDASGDCSVSKIMPATYTTGKYRESASAEGVNSDAVTFDVIEPQTTVTFSFSPSSIYLGGTVTYSVTGQKNTDYNLKLTSPSNIDYDFALCNTGEAASCSWTGTIQPGVEPGSWKAQAHAGSLQSAVKTFTVSKCTSSSQCASGKVCSISSGVCDLP